jgi:RNA polymerase sigma-70 factor (ECF subfamily)
MSWGAGAGPDLEPGRGRAAIPRGAADHDDAFVRSLYEQHGRSLLAYATRLTNDRFAAEDVVQETLLRAWRNADRLAGSDFVRAWLLTVAHNIVIDRLRARSVRPREIAESAMTAPVSGDHGERVADAVTVLSAVNSLPAHHREVLVEVYYRGSRPADVARLLGIPDATLRSRLSGALRALRGAVITDHPEDHAHAGRCVNA